jgi:hypothetical protein
MSQAAARPRKDVHQGQPWIGFEKARKYLTPAGERTGLRPQDSAAISRPTRNHGFGV